MNLWYIETLMLICVCVCMWCIHIALAFDVLEWDYDRQFEENCLFSEQRGGHARVTLAYPAQLRPKISSIIGLKNETLRQRITLFVEA